MGEHMILGAAFRALGGFPSGWRMPGAERSPRREPTVLVKAAKIAEQARFDYLYFGDWLSTGPELEATAPHLLARVDPLSAVAFLAASTRRIGLITSVNTTYSEVYAIARQTASVDLLSGGRLGLNLHVGANALAAANHGKDVEWDRLNAYDRAVEFLDAMRLLWDSWDDDAFVADAASGRLIDQSRLHPTDFTGRFVQTAGPLNALRPVQGAVPITHTGTSPRAHELVATRGNLAIADFESAAEAFNYRAELRAAALAAGREESELPKLVIPVLPVVAATPERAQALADELLSLIAPGTRARLPGLLVGDGPAVADRLEQWFGSGAVDGFQILSAWMPAQLDAFAELVVPELQARGVVRTEYEGRTLRGHLGLRHPLSSYAVDA
ncbi:LLM class flavin-dependent oxidoreductase [Gryllotalpicola protaetiae]|uniref:LLM class flavin-dependent oxidoreductase n=1 Tax=Gryllotalpicola protaetiae TaxID=2419771 RepID=A0A387BMF3_9MICO|nr:LLM class flavin-dependent oxidoreductase [Gryllotalpicola protaetiae]AYG02206.1 LLM class flavin-dependent oxidoreductase [Gryllotalpicola protaetiae]